MDLSPKCWKHMHMYATSAQGSPIVLSSQSSTATGLWTHEPIEMNEINKKVGERRCLYVAEVPVELQPQTMLCMPKSPWTMRTLLLLAASSPQGERRSWSCRICEIEAGDAQGMVASNC